MESFRQFIEQTEEQEKNVKNTLNKLPKSHRKWLSQYEIKWQCDNTLNGDDEHVGVINPNNKTITVAAPWRYSRQFTFLHEIAHKVFEKFMTKKMFNTWKDIVKNTKNKMNQNAEELFCMAYANHFSDHKVVKHDHPEWEGFVKNFIKKTG